MHARVPAHGAGRFMLIGMLFHVRGRGVGSDDCGLLLRRCGPVVGRY